MTFEERLLVELKAEVTRRATRRRRVVRGSRLLAVAVAAGLAVAVPAVAPLTRDGRAYAMTENHDGSMTVQIKEFRRPDRLRAELAAHGARTDITFLPPHKRCAGDRGTPVDPQPTTTDPARVREFLRRHPVMPSQQAFRWVRPGTTPVVFQIVPAHIGPGQTLVLELAESMTTGHWKVGPFLVAGLVKPCVLEDDPTWN